MADGIDYQNLSQKERDYAQEAFGGIDAFIGNYGTHTASGTPRFGKDYSFLVEVDELTPLDRYFHDREVDRREVILIQTGKPYSNAPKEEKGFWKTLFGM